MVDHRYEGQSRGNFVRAAFVEKDMTLTVRYEDENGDEVSYALPAAYNVCETCRGTGKHVNPSIDVDGISADVFLEDPDFSDDYFAGVYDVACYECLGQRVVAEIDQTGLTGEAKLAYYQWVKQEESRIEFERQSAYERHMGY